MFRNIKCLLFPTNLSENCRNALEASIAIAAQNQATLILLHVFDKEIPDHIEAHFVSLLGEKKWEDIKKRHEEDVYQTLTGKLSAVKVGENVIREYSEEAGIYNAAPGFNWKEIVVEHPDIPGTILKQAVKHNCDLVILGSREGFFGWNSIGSKTKGVLRNCRIPVMIVPSRHEKH